MMVGNWEIWLRLVSKLIGRGDACLKVIYKVKTWNNLNISIIHPLLFDWRLGSCGQQVPKALRLIKKLCLYILLGEYPLFSLYC